MMKIRRISKVGKNRGVTIVELLVYIGLLSIFMIVLIDVFVTILKSRLESESTSTLNQDARYILTRLSYDVTNSASFSVPNPSTLVVGGNTYTLTGNNLTLNSVKLNGADTKVTNLSFTKIGTTVKTSITLESLINLSSGNQSRTIQSTFGVRP